MVRNVGCRSGRLDDTVMLGVIPKEWTGPRAAGLGMRRPVIWRRVCLFYCTDLAFAFPFRGTSGCDFTCLHELANISTPC